MVEAIVKHGILFYAMGIMMGIGIFAKIISNTTVRKMVREASTIQKSNHRLMRLIKSKFEHASMVSDKVQNVRVFAKKYLYEYRAWGMRLSTWQGLQKKSLWLIGAIGTLGTYASFRMYGMEELTFQYISWTGVLMVVLFVIQMMTDEKTNMDAAENYIVDYLENVCINRYEKVNQELTNFEEMEIPKPDLKREPEVSDERTQQEIRIRAILEEFLA